MRCPCAQPRSSARVQTQHALLRPLSPALPALLSSHPCPCSNGSPSPPRALQGRGGPKARGCASPCPTAQCLAVPHAPALLGPAPTASWVQATLGAVQAELDANQHEAAWPYMGDMSPLHSSPCHHHPCPAHAPHVPQTHMLPSQMLPRIPPVSPLATPESSQPLSLSASQPPPLRWPCRAPLIPPSYPPHAPSCPLRWPCFARPVPVVRWTKRSVSQRWSPPCRHHGGA